MVSHIQYSHPYNHDYHYCSHSVERTNVSSVLNEMITTIERADIIHASASVYTQNTYPNKPLSKALPQPVTSLSPLPTSSVMVQHTPPYNLSSNIGSLPFHPSPYVTTTTTSIATLYYNSNMSVYNPSFPLRSSHLYPFSKSYLPNSSPPLSMLRSPQKKKLLLSLTKHPMTLPSPYATTHEILPQNIIIVKSSKNGSSFGVDVKYDNSQTALVDPSFLKTMGMSNNRETNKEKENKTNNTAVIKNETKNDDHDDLLVRKGEREKVPLDALILNTDETKQTQTCLNTVIPAKPVVKQVNNTASAISENVKQEENSLSPFPITEPTNAPTTTTQNECVEKPNKEDTPTTNAPQFSIDHEKKKRRQRRRRVPFGVLMVADPTKQNLRWEKNDQQKKSENHNDVCNHDDGCSGKEENIKLVASQTDIIVETKTETDSKEELDKDNKKEDEEGKKGISHALLMEGDLILSINGKSVGGLTFGEACALFSAPPPPSRPPEVEMSKATETREQCKKNITEKVDDDEEENLIRCVLVVARRRKDSPKDQKKRNDDQRAKLSIKVKKDDKEKDKGAVKMEEIGITADEGASEKEENKEKIHHDLKKSDLIQSTPGSASNNENMSSSSTAIDKLGAKSLPVIPIIPLVTVEKQGSLHITSGEFSNIELRAFLLAMLHVQHPCFFMKCHLSMMESMVHAIKTHPMYGPTLQHRSSQTLMDRWTVAGLKVEKEMVSLADAHWKLNWQREINYVDDNRSNSAGHIRNMELMYLSDAKRSELRSQPRPVMGCKCGSDTHSYVNDEDCVLYRNLRRLEGLTKYDDDDTIMGESMIDINGKKRRTKEGKSNQVKKQRTVQTAYVEKFKRIQAEMESEREEAEFVHRMERIQIAQEKKAIFAPSSLSVMIICALAHLKDVNVDNQVHVLDSAIKETNENGKDLPEIDEDTESSSEKEDSPDDEDDILLTALGSSSLEPLKRRGMWKNPHPFFLAEIMFYISKTWGHVYIEPTHLDYAWQCRELFKKRRSKKIRSGDELSIKNPRNPNERSFENIQFILTDDLRSRLKEDWMLSKPLQAKICAGEEKATLLGGKRAITNIQNSSFLSINMHEKTEDINDAIKKDPPTKETIDTLLLTYLASEFKTGLCKELQSLAEMGVLNVTPLGAIVLAVSYF
uniref:PDZ domain-containing protein n=1 Tax=Ditylum brightwellii TaxID=49249 RepID=A0A7S4VDE1_9STRA